MRLTSSPRAIAAALLAVTPIAVTMAACAGRGESADPARLGSTSQRIVNGTKSTAAQDYTVLIGFDTDGKREPLCTGALVAKNLVITARHCTGDFDETTQTVTDYVPSRLTVFTGVDAPTRVLHGQPDATATKVFHTPGNALVPDIVLLMLDKDLSEPVVAMRLTGGAVKGESIDIVGYGITQQNGYPLSRQQRTGLIVETTAPAITKHFDLFPGEFQFGEGACRGDSGGPAVSSTTGALVGIATRVDNGQAADAGSSASFCIGTSAEDVYTDLTPAKSVIDEAFAAAGATPIPEQAASAPDASTGAQDKPADATSGGCSAGGARTRLSPSVPAGLVAIVVGATRRRRRRLLSR